MNPPPIPEPPKLPRPKGAYKYLWLTLGGLALLAVIGVSVGWNQKVEDAERMVIDKIEDRLGFGPKWQKRDFGALTLEVPFPLKSSAPGNPKVEESDREEVLESEVFEGDHSRLGVSVQVMVIKYAPKVWIDVDEAAHKSMEQSAKYLGDEQPKIAITPASYPGAEARRGGYDGNLMKKVLGGVPGMGMRVESLYVFREPDYWQIVVTSHDETTATAKRIIDSVRLAPVPGK